MKQSVAPTQKLKPPRGHGEIKPRSVQILCRLFRRIRHTWFISGSGLLWRVRSDAATKRELDQL